MGHIAAPPDRVPAEPLRLGVRARWLLDGGLVLLVVVIALPTLFHSSGSIGLNAALSAGLSAPLLVRRHFPVAVFGVIAGVALLQWGIGHKLFADVALLAALYAVAAFSSRRSAVTAWAFVELGCLLAVLRWHPHPGGLFGFVLLSGMSAAALASGLLIATRRDYLSALQERADRLERERDQQGALAAAAERARIAREMHDIVAHHLTVMVAVSDGAVAMSDAAPRRSVEAMRTVSSVGREALRDTRRLLGVLRSDADPALASLEPLPDLGNVDELVEQVRHTGLGVNVIVEGAPADLPVDVPLTVYRIVQEALTNTLKHARSPGLVTVRLRHSPGRVLIEVTDDGEPAMSSSAGHGLTGMRERVHAWGGSVVAGPISPQGWRVRAELFFEGATVPA